MRTTCMQSEASLETAALPALHLTGWSKLRTAWEGVLEKFAPLGYEDQTGFHFGVEPVAERPYPANRSSRQGEMV